MRLTSFVGELRPTGVTTRPEWAQSVGRLESRQKQKSQLKKGRGHPSQDTRMPSIFFRLIGSLSTWRTPLRVGPWPLRLRALVDAFCHLARGLLFRPQP